jgi:DNA segregation ATPase FtsK/SpoIIIE-like protein
MMRARYDEDAAYHRGQRGKPELPRWLVVLEEIQEIRTVLGKKVVDPFLQQISRQIRASNGRLVVVTQRPDTDDAIPGAVRDMLEERIILGFVSGTGARMVLDKDWQAVTDEYGHTPVPGRGMGRVTGRLVRLQSFRLDLPREHPELEVFYPPATGPVATEDRSAQEHRSGTLPDTQTRWAPPPVQADDEAPTPPSGVPTAADTSQPTPPDRVSPTRRRPTV